MAQGESRRPDPGRAQSESSTAGQGTQAAQGSGSWTIKTHVWYVISDPNSAVIRDGAGLSLARTVPGPFWGGSIKQPFTQHAGLPGPSPSALRCQLPAAD